MDHKKIQLRMESGFQSLDQHTLGVPGVIRRASETFSHVYGPEAAGGIAYYALFALFPLLLLLTSIASIWLVSADAVQDAITLIGDMLNIPMDQLMPALEQITSSSSISGIIGLVGLIWSATGVFTSLARNVNRAWPEAGLVSVIQGRLMAVIMVGLLAISQFVWVIATTLISLISRYALSISADYSNARNILTNFTINLISFALFFLAFVGLYRWVPKTKVRWSEAFWGAAFSTIATFLASRLYIWFLNTGLTSYESVYGSLSTTLGVIVFFYINAWIVLFGAHLSSSVAYSYRKTQARQVDQPIEADPDQDTTADGNESIPD